jgi:hypothetical protein
MHPLSFHHHGFQLYNTLLGTAPGFSHIHYPAINTATDIQSLFFHNISTPTSSIRSSSPSFFAVPLSPLSPVSPETRSGFLFERDNASPFLLNSPTSNSPGLSVRNFDWTPILDTSSNNPSPKVSLSPFSFERLHSLSPQVQNTLFDESNSEAIQPQPHGISMNFIHDPINTRISTDNFIASINQLNADQIYLYIKFNFKVIVNKYQEVVIESLLSNINFFNAFKRLVLNKNWTLGFLLNRFPSIQLHNRSADFKGCCQKTALDNNSFRFHISTQAIVNLINSSTDLEKLSFFYPFRGKWNLFPHSSASHLIHIFKTFDKTYQLSKQVIESCFHEHLRFIEPNAQKTLMNLSIVAKSTYQFFKNDAESLKKFFRTDIFRDTQEMQLYFFPFLNEQDQYKIISDIFFKKRLFTETWFVGFSQTTNFEKLPHYLIPHFLLHRKVPKLPPISLYFLQEKTLQDVKNHIISLVNDSYIDPDKRFFMEESREQQVISRLHQYEDRKVLLEELPLQEFLYLAQKYEYLRKYFTCHTSFYSTLCASLNLYEQELFAFVDSQICEFLNSVN